VPHGELTAKKWLNSIDKQKRSNLKERDRQRDRETESTVDNNDFQLGTEIKKRGIHAKQIMQQGENRFHANKSAYA